MPKVISFRRGLLSVLFWSIISAAFIGPGTVTTAAKAGSALGLQLLGALIFSILATIVLQEAAARLTIASGKNLGEIIALKYQGTRSYRLKILLFLAVAFGCAAYQAGNILGAIAGLELFTTWQRPVLVAGIGLICAALLWIGNFRIIANLLGLIVALMGIAFIIVAFRAGVGTPEINTSTDAGLLAIGLIGTTIVPYNLFLASGLSKEQDLREMRIGLISAILIGGLISVAILIVGTQVKGTFSFSTLAQTMSANLGPWAAAFFGFGLFAAGMSSSITAPLAAAVTGSSLFGNSETKWSPKSRNFRAVWLTVLGIGVFFGLLEIKPIPAIILAQAINGILLPIVAIFLLIAVNDRQLIPADYLNSKAINGLMLLIVWVSCFLGLYNLVNAGNKVMALPWLQHYPTAVALEILFSFLIVGSIARRIFFTNKASQ